MTPPEEATATHESPSPHTSHGDVIDTDSSSSPPTSPRDEAAAPQRRPLLWLAVTLAVASAVFAGWAGLRWWEASHDDSLELARTRDQVLIAAHTHIETLTSLDHRNAEEGLEAWLDASTGDLRDEFATLDEEQREAIEAAGKVTTGRVVEAAVIDLSAGGDSASVIAAVEISVEPEVGETAVKRNRFTADLLRVDGDWKLATLAQVPVVSP